MIKNHFKGVLFMMSLCVMNGSFAEEMCGLEPPKEPDSPCASSDFSPFENDQQDHEEDDKEKPQFGQAKDWTWHPDHSEDDIFPLQGLLYSVQSGEGFNL